jgi:hypothetical protein
MLRKTPLEGADVVKGGGDALAEDGDEDDDRHARETPQHAAERDPPPPQWPMRAPGAGRVGGEHGVLLAQRARKDSEGDPRVHRRRGEKTREAACFRNTVEAVMSKVDALSGFGPLVTADLFTL